MKNRQSWGGRKEAGGMRRVFGVVVPCNSCFWISEGDNRTGGRAVVRASKWTHFLCSFLSPDDILNPLGDGRFFCMQSPKPMTLTTTWGFCKSRLIPGCMSVSGEEPNVFILVHDMGWPSLMSSFSFCFFSKFTSYYVPLYSDALPNWFFVCLFFCFFFPARNTPSSSQLQSSVLPGSYPSLL